MSGVILVDAHVHLYPGFDFSRAFSAALGNLGGASILAPDGSPGADVTAPNVAAPDVTAPNVAAPNVCLCLTDDRQSDTFAALSTFEQDRWSIHPHADGRTIRVRDNESEAGLWLFAGKQLVTAERLEVLALLAGPNETQDLRDGESLAGTVDRVQAAGALPVLPWAFGKWWFSRGRLVSHFLRTTGTPVFLGDNGGRWKGLGGLRPFPLGRELGRPVLPGSDPLPLPGHEDRIGRYGFLLGATLDEDAPAKSLSAALSNLEQSPQPVGSTVTLSEFLVDQWKLRTNRLPSPEGSR